MNLNRLRKWIAVPLTLAMLYVPWPNADEPAYAASGNNSCLYLTGSILTDSGADSVMMHSPFTFQYKINPQGSFPPQTGRDAVNIVLVLDDSGSMNYAMGSSPRPTRLETLKQSAVTFADEIAKAGANDKLGMIRFNSLATTTLGLTTDYANVKRKINEMNYGGGTNIEDGLNRAKSMLTGSRDKVNKYVILLTDGEATHYNSNGRAINDKKRAKDLSGQRARELAALQIPVYTIALGKKGASDVDHDLLINISSTTKGTKYDASDVNELTKVFQNIIREIKDANIKRIEIRQPLPPGFVLADGNPDNVSIVGNELVIRLADIPYPFTTSEITVNVRLKQVEMPGTHVFPDARLNYETMCSDGSSSNQNGNLTNGHTITVTGWVDRWGNLYVGDETGAVSRYRHGDASQKQFTVPGSGKLVENVTFSDTDWGDDDAIVHVEYADGSKATWKLHPAAPSIALKGATGGNSRLSIAGDGLQLPENTEYAGANDDFAESRYVSGYEYRIAGGEWTKLSVGQEAVIPSSRGGVDLQARALTAAVSGDSGQQTGGDVASAVGWIDRWGNLYVGDVSGAVSRYRLGDMDEKQFTVPGKGQPVKSISFADSAWGEDDAIVHVEYADGSKAAWNLYPTAPIIGLKDAKGKAYSDQEWQLGKGKIGVSGGARQLPPNTSFSGANQDFQNDYIQGFEYRVDDGNWKPIAAGAQDELAKLGANIALRARAVTMAISGSAAALTAGAEGQATTSLDATAPAIAIQTGDDTKNTNPTITVQVNEPESPLQRVEIEIDVLAIVDGKEKLVAIDPVVKTYTGNTQSDTITIQLGGKFPGKIAPSGHYQIRVRATNTVGLEANAKNSFLVNPGPSGELKTGNGQDYSTKTRASSTPVLVKLEGVNRIIVPARTIDGVPYPEITLKQVEYQINGGKWAKLGAFQFQVTNNGENNIKVRLTDSTGNAVLRELKVHINYDQRRH
ncbi:VWA domain-containing protein [Paenibacillaceae bacterium WGS1546]|uniref:vWA domain-containing protein n=1 Tax=Cohnella sp. WGS1546 TaxID=3366810 RepID=UPI00372D3FD6